MMNVILRNLFRLLRAGAFGEQEQIEPLSPWKWRRLYLLAQKHGISSYVDKGFERLEGQFFLQLPGDLPIGEKAQAEVMVQTEEPKLTNPMLKRAMKKIVDEEAEGNDNTYTLQLLRKLTSITTSILSSGIPLRQLIQLGLFLRSNSDKVDYQKLRSWIERLHMQRMAQLIGQLLVYLFHFSKEEVPFMSVKKEEEIDKIIEELFQQPDDASSEWLFEQGNDIFVHTSDSSAMFWQVRHSARYFRYFPSESVTRFFSSFLRSLQNIEE